MALLFMDGFDYYGAVAQVLQRWTSTNISSSSLGTGRSGSGQCFQLNNASGQPHFYKLLHPTTDYSTIIFGFWFRVDSLSNGDKSIIYICSNATASIEAAVAYTAAGALEIRRGNAASGTILGTTPVLLATNTWTHIEVKYTAHNTTGQFALKVNGILYLDYAGDTTAGGAAAVDSLLHFGSNSGVMTKSFDDYFCCDNSGSINNDWMGMCSVRTLAPDGAGDETDWVPSAGSNYQCVDEATANDDTDYVAAATAGDRDLYTLNTAGLTSVQQPAGVEVVLRSRKDDATARTLAPTMKSGTTDADHATYTTTGSYVWTPHQVQETDPNTSAAWTPAAIEALQAGVKVVS